MNAKKEFLSFTKNNKIKCAQIEGMDLKVGFTTEEYNKFINNLDFEYNAGYGGQELYGTIWFTDGTWATRGEYDGSEWWEIHQLPEIPEELI